MSTSSGTPTTGLNVSPLFVSPLADTLKGFPNGLCKVLRIVSVIGTQSIVS